MLDLTQVLTYSVALGIAAAIPGPGMAALVALAIAIGSSIAFWIVLSGILPPP